MDDLQANNNVGKENRKAFRQLCIVAFIVLAIFIANRISYRHNMELIEKTALALQGGSPETRLAAVETLGEFDMPEAKAVLLVALKDTSSDVRARAAVLLDGWKDERALSVLLKAVKDKDDEVRFSAASSLTFFTGVEGSTSEVTGQQQTAAASALDKAFREKDLPVIAGAINYFIAKGEDGTEAMLISTLKTRGTEWMAEVFLNCGNNELSSAAEQWAVKHGYRVEEWRGQQPIAVGSSWGSFAP